MEKVNRLFFHAFFSKKKNCVKNKFSKFNFLNLIQKLSFLEDLYRNLFSKTAPLLKLTCIFLTQL